MKERTEQSINRFSLVFTFLFLAALYESFMTPFAIILSVPIAMVGAVGALLIAGESLTDELVAAGGVYGRLYESWQRGPTANR